MSTNSEGTETFKRELRDRSAIWNNLTQNPKRILCIETDQQAFNARELFFISDSYVKFIDNFSVFGLQHLLIFHIISEQHLIRRHSLLVHIRPYVLSMNLFRVLVQVVPFEVS
jgi:hypothetical protein